MVGRPALLDRLLVLLLVLLGLAPFIATYLVGSPRLLEAPGLLLLVAQTIPLLWRRTRPFEVAVIVAGASAARLALGRPDPVTGLAMVVAVYSVSVYGSTRLRLVVAGLALGAIVAGAAGLLLTGQRDPWPGVLTPGAISLAAWVVGDYLRNRRRYLAEVEARAQRLEDEAKADRRRAAEEERLRIARELHDVVAHQVSLMAIQAGAARVGHRQEEKAALAAIESSARETLAELNRLLGVLRRDGAAPARAPQPGLSQVESLLQGVRDAGLRARLEVKGEPRALAAALDLSAYRLLQEAVTNALKHAAASRVEVTITYSPATLELLIRDDGRGGAAQPGAVGHGLIGMRERVELFGGSLETGSSDLGGFRVRARLPLS